MLLKSFVNESLGFSLIILHTTLASLLLVYGLINPSCRPVFRQHQVKDSGRSGRYGHLHSMSRMHYYSTATVGILRAYPWLEGRHYLSNLIERATALRVIQPARVRFRIRVEETRLAVRRLVLDAIHARVVPIRIALHHRGPDRMAVNHPPQNPVRPVHPDISKPTFKVDIGYPVHPGQAFKSDALGES